MKHQYTYDCYYNYKQITDTLVKLREENSDITRLSSLATTPQGREIWLLEITDKSTGDFADKPAIYVEGNIHAGEVTGSMSVMYFLDTIFSNRNEKSVEDMLKNYTVYAVPRLSPDGSENYLTTAFTVRSSPKDYVYTSDMPGLNKKDIDGDGVIRMMRVKSDYGAWKVSKLDDRLMTRRLADDIEGDFYNVFDEGEIIDFDGINIVNAPIRNGNDFNRNYPFCWETEHKQRGAGDYPLANAETKANAEFLMTHPNVCFVLDMHTAGGQNLYTPGYKTRKESIKEDVFLNKTLALMAEKENTYPAINIYDEYLPQGFEGGIYGSFCDFCHFMVGVPTIAIECWDLNVRAGIEMLYPPKAEISEQEQEENAHKVLKWADENVAKEDGFMPWTSFEHSQLGTVEIGGYNNKYIRQNPPKKLLHQEAEKHSRFMHRAVKTLPRVNFDDIKVTAVQADVYKIEVIVGNKGFMPSYALKESLKNKGFKELSLQITGDIEIINGKQEEKIGHLGGLMNMQTENTPVGAYTSQSMELRKKVQWIVKAEKGSEITVKCSGARIGKIQTTITI